MNRKFVIGIAGLLFLTAGAVQADPGDYGRDSQGSYYATAAVVNVEPIVRYVSVDNPQRQCWHETVEYDGRRRAAGNMIAGGIIGGVIGSQIGRGNGRAAATLVGTLVGSAMGHDAAVNAPPRYAAVRRCRISHDYSEEQRIEGYRVTYRYEGRTYTTRMATQPGRRIRVLVSVQPVDD